MSLSRRGAVSESIAPLRARLVKDSVLQLFRLRDLNQLVDILLSELWPDGVLPVRKSTQATHRNSATVHESSSGPREGSFMEPCAYSHGHGTQLLSSTCPNGTANVMPEFVNVCWLRNT